VSDLKSKKVPVLHVEGVKPFIVRLVDKRSKKREKEE
jgi:hypothetical protein